MFYLFKLNLVEYLVGKLLIHDIPRLRIVDNDVFELTWSNQAWRIPKLKHQVCYLMPSYLATQIYYCEYRVHLDYLRGREINEKAIEGILEHSRQLYGVKHKIDYDIYLEEGKQPVLINRGLEGVYFFNRLVA